MSVSDAIVYGYGCKIRTYCNEDWIRELLSALSLGSCLQTTDDDGLVVCALVNRKYAMGCWLRHGAGGVYNGDKSTIRRLSSTVSRKCLKTLVSSTNGSILM